MITVLINDFDNFQGELYRPVKPDDCYWSIGTVLLTTIDDPLTIVH